MHTTTEVLFIDESGCEQNVPGRLSTGGVVLAATDPLVGVLEGDLVRTSPGHLGAPLFEALLWRKGVAATVTTGDPATANQAETILASAGLAPVRNGTSLIVGLAEDQIRPLAQRLGTCDLALRVMDESDLVPLRPMSLDRLADAFTERSPGSSPVDALCAILDRQPDELAAPILHRAVVVPSSDQRPDAGGIEALERLATQIGSTAARWARRYDRASRITWSEVTVADGCSAAWAFTGSHPDRTAAVTAVAWVSAAADQGPRTLFVACNLLAPVPCEWSQAYLRFAATLQMEAAGVNA